MGAHGRQRIIHLGGGGGGDCGGGEGGLGGGGEGGGGEGGGGEGGGGLGGGGEGGGGLGGGELGVGGAVLGFGGGLRSRDELPGGFNATSKKVSSALQQHSQHSLSPLGRWKYNHKKTIGACGIT